MRLTFKEVKDKIKKMVPKDLEYEVELESASIAIVTPTPRQFDRGGLLGKIGSAVKRRIVLRPSDDILMEEEKAEIRIREEIPDGIDISVVHFDRCLKEVLIQCDDPGNALYPRR